MPIRIVMVVEEKPAGVMPGPGAIPVTKVEVMAVPQEVAPVTERERRMVSLLAGAFRLVGESEAKQNLGGRILMQSRPGQGPDGNKEGA